MKKAKLLLLFLLLFIPVLVFATEDENVEVVEDVSNQIVLNANIEKGNNNSLKLTWDYEKEGAVFEIYRSEKETKGYKKIKTLEGNTYTNTGLTYGKTYYYIINTKIDDELVTSNTVKMKVVPNKVENIKLTAYDKKIKVSYGKVNVSGYQIQRSTDGIKWSTIRTVRSSKTLSYTNTRLSVNKTYYYRVRAYKSSWGRKIYGPWSLVVSTKTAPGTPKYSIKATNYNEITVNISKVSGAHSYQIYRSTKSRSGFKKVGTTEVEGAYKDTTAIPKVKYYYKVRACNENNTCGSFGKVYNTKTSIKTPTLKIKSTTYSNLSWNNIDYATGYEVYFATSKLGKFSKIATVTENSYVKKNLKLNKTYYYKVRMFVELNGKKYYGNYSSVVSSKVQIGKITNYNLSVSGADVTTSFTVVPDVDGYVVARSLSEKGPFEEIFVENDKLTVNAETSLASYTYGAEEFIKYYYKVRPYALVNNVKNYGAYTELKTIETGSSIPEEYRAVMDAVHEHEGEFASRYELRQLLKDNFTEAEINFAVENVRLDWNVVAHDYVDLLLEEEYFSAEDIMYIMLDEEFTEDEIERAMGHVDFKKVALDLVKGNEYKYYSESSLRELLTQRAFTEEEINYAVEHFTNSFTDVAYSYGLSEHMHYTKSGVRQLLTNAGFTEEQVNAAMEMLEDGAYQIKYAYRKEENKISKGDMINIGGEFFYVIDADKDETTLLAKESLHIDNEADKDENYGLQASITEKDVTPFSSSNYWINKDTEILLAQYGEDYPAYVYGPNSYAYSYVDNYTQMLSNLELLGSIDGRLLSINDLLALGCNSEDTLEVSACEDAPSWLTNDVSGTQIWLGDAHGKLDIYTLFGDSLRSDRFTYNGSIRPVIVVDTAHIPGENQFVDEPEEPVVDEGLNTFKNIVYVLYQAAKEQFLVDVDHIEGETFTYGNAGCYDEMIPLGGENVPEFSYNIVMTNEGKITRYRIIYENYYYDSGVVENLAEDDIVVSRDTEPFTLEACPIGD